MGKSPGVNHLSTIPNRYETRMLRKNAGTAMHSCPIVVPSHSKRVPDFCAESSPKGTEHSTIIMKLMTIMRSVTLSLGMIRPATGCL